MKYKNFSEVTVKTCRLTSKKSDIFRLDIFWEKACIEPGQFIMIKSMDEKSVMPRPFSVYKINGKTISLLIQKVGRNTNLFSQLIPGNKIKVRGPLGKTVSIDLRFKNYILVGGGIGTAQLVPLAKKLKKGRGLIKVLLGGKTPSQIVGLKDFRNYGCLTKTITEHGRKSNGLVTDLLKKELESNGKKCTIVACGPKPMLKAITKIASRGGHECIIILEEVMACGTGDCKGCTVFMKNGKTKQICTDGPAFNTRDIHLEKTFPISISSSLPKSPKMDNPMETVLAGKNGRNLVLSHPTMNASGCLDYQAIKEGWIDISHVGALVTKGVGLYPSLGNNTPRMCEVESGMINSIGLENPGIKKFISKILPVWLSFEKPVIINIYGKSIEEYAKIAKKLSKTKIAAIEVNISCPNVKKGGMLFGQNAKYAYEVVRAVRREIPEIHLITKLTPNVTDVIPIAKAAIRGGSDAISLINTVKSMAINVFSRRPLIKNVMGGMSGPAIKPMAIRMVYELFSASHGVPIIGIGGITSGKDVAEFMLAGSNAIAVGTELFRNPNVFTEIHGDLLKIMKHHGVNRIQDLVGKVIT